MVIIDYMSITVVGSVGIDTVETPFGVKENILGGAAVYFAFAASLYAKVNFVGAVGDDFPKEHLELLKSRENICTDGLEIISGETFKWHGKYEYDMNIRHTLDLKLGLFSDFKPKIPELYKSAPYLFLANIDPALQLDVLSQVNATFKMMDTMDFWIANKRNELDEVISNVDLVLMNDFEMRQYSSTYSLTEGAKKILKMGPDAVIIKKGEHGALMVTNDSCFVAPAYPMCEVKDPTGAGDSFAGGFLGYIAQNGGLSTESIKKAIIHGSVVASYVVEDFSLDKLIEVGTSEIESRYNAFEELVRF